MTRAPSDLVIRPNRPIRKYVLLGVLLALLAVVGYTAYYFALNRSLPKLSPAPAEAEAVPAPEYLYSVAGTGANALGRPVGVAISKDNRLFVSDSARARISVFTLDGRYLSSFNTIKDGSNTKLVTPVHIAFDAKGDLWVTDRTLDAVYVFDASGRYLRKFTPTGVPKPDWSPLAITFGPDGRLYLSDVRNTQKHNIEVFDASGTKLTQWGKTTQVNRSTDAPGDFYFPNGIAVSRSGLVFVADGNNRRVQVFDRTGRFQYFIATSGIPRGIFVDEANKRLLVTDALAQQVTLYSLSGETLVNFGEGGIAGGQFQYPNDLTLDSQGRIFVADRENHQVQVWGWPKAAGPAAVVSAVAPYWYLCLAPLLLLPLLLLRRRRDFVLTPDFVDALIGMDALGLMEQRKLRWIAPEADHEQSYAGRSELGVDLGQLIHPEPYSESDAREVQELLHCDEPASIVLAMAQRAQRLATEDVEMRRLALMLGIDVLDAAEFSNRYPDRSDRTKRIDSTGGPR